MKLFYTVLFFVNDQISCQVFPDCCWLPLRTLMLHKLLILVRFFFIFCFISLDFMWICRLDEKRRERKKSFFSQTEIVWKGKQQKEIKHFSKSARHMQIIGSLVLLIFCCMRNGSKILRKSCRESIQFQFTHRQLEGVEDSTQIEPWWSWMLRDRTLS